MKTSYTNAEIDSMVSDVTSQLDALLKSEGATLLKKDEGEDMGGEDMEMTQKAAPDASAAPAPSPEASQTADQALPDDNANPAAPDASAAPQGDAPPSMEELVQAYASLAPDELQLHAQALAQVMQAQSGAAPAPDASAAPAPAAPLAGDASQGVTPEGQAAMKSEIAAIRADYVALKKHAEQLEGIVKNVVKPTVVVSPGKAITGNNVLVKSEGTTQPLTKTEVVEKLNAKAKDPNLAKSDRDLIRKYYTGTGTLNSLSHLLK